MKPVFPLLLFLLSLGTLIAQDVYHSATQADLMSGFGLPPGIFMLNTTEEATLDDAYWYGDLNVSTQSVSGQPFTLMASMEVNSSGANQWDAGYAVQNNNTLYAGDACLMILFLRSNNGPGKVSLFAENTTTYEKEIYMTLDLSEQWTYFLIPFEANQNYQAGDLAFGLHLAWQEQTIEAGGLIVLNYGDEVSVDDLPVDTNNDEYGGYEANAPWRDEAAERIEQIRKANLTVKVEDADGMPIPGATVDVEMLQHQYAFGSAVVSRLFAGNNSHNEVYESKLLDLDGEGHGFNWVVMENALKWPGWEQNWITSKPETANAVQWLVDHNIKVRGHNLLWPGWSNLPPDIEANQNDVDYIRNRINDHIEEIVTYPGIQGNIAEWDVLNEITTNRDLEYALQGQPGFTTGREIYTEVFNKLTELDPDTKTYTNDYVTISQNNTEGGLYELKKQFTQELIDSGVQLDGIGFQGHIGGFPNSIYDVYNTLEDFSTTFGRTAKITEYDINEAVDDELAARYLRDFMTIVFSHQSTDGFMMWGFWDGAHWHDNAPMYYQDWTLKPSGEAFIDLVFNEWWTEDNGMTDGEGEYNVRGFKGRYKITVDCGDEILVDTIDLYQDITLLKQEGQLTVNTGEELDAPSFRIYPNPAKDLLTIDNPLGLETQVYIFDPAGRQVYAQQVNGTQETIPLNFGSGIFEVVVESNGKRFVERVVVK